MHASDAALGATKLLKFDISDTGRLFVETPQVRSAFEQLTTVLDISRQDDRSWRPLVCLVGPTGSGKTEVMTRFMLSAQRAVSCGLASHLESEMRDVVETRRLWSPEVVEARERHWQAFRTGIEDPRDTSGLCLAHCAPASWFPEGRLRDELKRVLAEGAHSAPVGLDTLKPDELLRNWTPSFSALGSPGNRSGDRRRRTTMLAIDDADQLLLLRKDKRRAWIAQVTDPRRWNWRWPLTYCFVGSPEVVEELRIHGKVHVIRLDGMPLDETWRDLVRRIFGSDEEADRLHAGTDGCIGPLLYAAEVRGLRSPYNIADAEIRRLPAPR